MTNRHTHNNDFVSLWTTTLVLLTALTAQPAGAAAPLATPRLIVGITVDQLRTDYLMALEDQLGEGGLRRLLQQGRVYEQVTYQLDNPDATTAIAVLATGSYPYQNGIGSQRVFDLQTLQRHSAFYDRQYLGNSTDGYWSPRALLSSTLADELMLAAQQQCKVFSIAAEPEHAIIGAGHSANGAFWIDDKTGRWASTTYYHEFPSFVQRLNAGGQPLFCDADNETWSMETMQSVKLAVAPYRDVLPYFIHRFRQDGRTHYPWLKTTPIANRAIAELAKQFISTGRLGLSAHTDMLQLTFYAGTFQHEKTEVYPAELQDIYMQLDKTLGELLTYVDEQVGLQNTVIYLTGTGDTNANTSDIPGLSMGEFNANRCTALLNSHLCTLHGQGQWIEGFEGDAIYLNHKTITQKQLQVDEVAREAADFVTLFSGVDEVFTARQLLREDYSDRVARRRNGYRKQGGGDLIIALQPGWCLRISDSQPTQPQIRHDVCPGPFILFAPATVKAERITAPIEGIVVAPTVAKAIRIRAPSASRGLALPLK